MEALKRVALLFPLTLAFLTGACGSTPDGDRQHPSTPSPAFEAKMLEVVGEFSGWFARYDTVNADADVEILLQELEILSKSAEALDAQMEDHAGLDGAYGDLVPLLQDLGGLRAQELAAMDGFDRDAQLYDVQTAAAQLTELLQAADGG